MTDNQQLALAAGGLVALAWFLRPTGTVTTYESYDLPGGQTSYSPNLMAFAEGIARAEGFYVSGSIPNRAKNPGAIKVPGWTGANLNGISVFDSVDQGWAQLYRQLWAIVTGSSGVYNLDMSIADMGDRYEADPGDAWSVNVASYLGVPRSTPLWAVLV